MNRYHDMESVNPYDHIYIAKVEHIKRKAPIVTQQLQNHLKSSPQLKSVVVDCVESIFKATNNL